jgi:hypothetical protein
MTIKTVPIPIAAPRFITSVLLAKEELSLRFETVTAQF